MRKLLVGAGGVGTAFARIAARRPFAELVIADYDLGRAQRAAAARDRWAGVGRVRGQRDRDQVSARIWLSTLAVLATGSAWRQSCSMTSR